MRSLLCAICLSMICACSTPRVYPDDLPPIPEDLLQECPVPEALPNGRPDSQVQVLRQDAEDQWKCHDRQKALADTVKFREKVYNSHK